MMSPKSNKEKPQVDSQEIEALDHVEIPKEKTPETPEDLANFATEKSTDIEQQVGDIKKRGEEALRIGVKSLEGSEADIKEGEEKISSLQQKAEEISEAASLKIQEQVGVENQEENSISDAIEEVIEDPEFREKALGYGLYYQATQKQADKAYEWYKHLSEPERQKVDMEREESRKKAAIGLGLNENAIQEEINKAYDWYEGLTDEERQGIDDRGETVAQAMENSKKSEIRKDERLEPTEMQKASILVEEKDEKSKIEEWKTQSEKTQRMLAEIEGTYGEEPLTPSQLLIVEVIKRQAEQQGIDIDSAAGQLGKVVIQQINGEFDKRYGFSFSDEQLPRVIVDSKNQAGAKDRTVYARKGIDRETGEIVEANIIAAKDMDDIVRGSSMSEELAHFYRDHLRPESEQQTDEILTEEFFGFLGRRLFAKSAEANPELAMYEDNQRKIVPQEQVVDLTTNLKKEIRFMEEIVEDWRKSGLDESQIAKAESAIEMVREKRKDYLIHQRGYRWAEKVDLSKIKDWKKLFSMPNKEVRRRFFTDSPDYEGL